MLTKPDLPENKAPTEYLASLKIVPKTRKVVVSWDKIRELATEDEQIVFCNKAEIHKGVISSKSSHLEDVIYDLTHQICSLPDGNRTTETLSNDRMMHSFIWRNSGAGIHICMYYTKVPARVEMVYTVQKIKED